MIITVKVRPTR